MNTSNSFGPMDELTRRGFIAASGVVALSGLPIPRSAWAGVSSEVLASGPPEIIAPPDGLLELVVDRTRMSISGRSTTSAITVNGSLPGPTIRMREGQDIEIRVKNLLPDQDTSIHWHGLLVPMNMDGVPGISFPGIKPFETFTYRFKLRQNGTYWYHSHSGLQEQLGHFGALIIDPIEPEPIQYEREYVIVLSDWMFESPYAVLKKLKKFDGYFNYQRPTLANLVTQAQSDGLGKAISDRLRWDAMRMDPTDIADITGAIYKYLMNGHSAAENWTAIASPGERIRLRLINSSTMTYYDFRIPGIPMTVIAADGQNVKPVEVDELRIAVAETYDVLITMPDDKAHTIFAETMDRSGFTRGTLAPRIGMSATVPARRERPMRTMADMGMANMPGMPGMTNMGSDSDAMKPMNTMTPSGQQPNDSMSGMSKGRTNPELSNPSKSIPTQNLSESVMHAPGGHGSGSSMTAKMPRRRYAEPGLGLGDDGWKVLTYADLRTLKRPPHRRAPDRQFDLHLTGNMRRYIWGFDGKKFSEAEMIRFKYGERLRINMINDTMMDHPIHLHGMWMDLYAGGDLDTNPRKHTVSVKPGELLSVDISADAPGQWAFHCHLLFHMDMGMFRTVAVVKSLERS